MVKPHPRNAVVYVIAVMTLMVLFPPWRFSRMHFGELSGPYAFIGSPPESPNADFKPEIDPVRLFVPMAIWLSASMVVLVRAERKRAEQRHRGHGPSGR